MTYFYNLRDLYISRTRCSAMKVVYPLVNTQIGVGYPLFTLHVTQLIFSRKNRLTVGMHISKLSLIFIVVP